MQTATKRRTAKTEQLGWLKRLPPVYFAMVMATATLALAARSHAFFFYSDALFAVSLIAYVGLFVLNIWRAVRFPRAVIGNLYSHHRCFEFFAFVAATSLLGAESLLLYSQTTVAWICWYAALTAWCVLTYSVFALTIVKPRKPNLPHGITGSWLLAVIATQAVASLAAELGTRGAAFDATLQFVALMLWLCGFMLYVWIIGLIFYRYTFFQFSPSDLSPPSWTNMGAVALSALVGTQLLNTEALPLLNELRGFVLGWTLLCWAVATWWVPMLVVLEVWRHVYHKFPLRYAPLYWGLVFPLAMYSLASDSVGRAVYQPFLHIIALVFFGIANGAWILTMGGMALSVRGGNLATRQRMK